ncbi:SDR family NAD(P)-dependent oxidoreductase [Streptomyces sp. SPB4]|uniref:SDR family NAD(P)-dependent oxidoreductase n=1 Tax=Streptomyces sp. SPB4 TaxID=2940553 RepID=UPI00247E50C0|nr:NADP-dependent 3-hydroxy acid dehydrogenase YdfG [Streptomyces sp. SPB4]
MERSPEPEEDPVMDAVDAALEGTVALVTGASSGIGAATAEVLAAHGAAVALVARRADRLEELSARLDAAGGTALVIAADMAYEAQVREAVERTVTELGRLDILVNNAGLMILGPAAAATTDEWRRMVDINLTGLMNTTHAALPHLAAAAAEGSRRVADVVNVSSVAGRVAFAGSSAYCATKYGVVAFSEALRQETAGRHVRVSVVEPGAVDTELREHNSPEVQEALTRRFGSIERLRARDVADAIGYVVTRPRHVAVAELLVRPTEQV